jgi:hypothetical protein
MFTTLHMGHYRPLETGMGQHYQATATEIKNHRIGIPKTSTSKSKESGV